MRPNSIILRYFSNLSSEKSKIVHFCFQKHRFFREASGWSGMEDGQTIPPCIPLG